MTQVLLLLSISCFGAVSVSPDDQSFSSLSESVVITGSECTRAGKIGACVRISRDSIMEIFIAKDRSSTKNKFAIKDHPMFGPQYNLDSLKMAQPEILFLDFDKFDPPGLKDFGSFFSSFKSIYWFMAIGFVLLGILFNRYLLNFARQSTNY